MLSPSQKSREEYNAYIKSFKWKKKKIEFYQQYKRKCQGCGKVNDIHVHHRSYEHFGNEFLHELRAVCSKCHKKIHDFEYKGYSLEEATDKVCGTTLREIVVSRRLQNRNKRLKRRKRKRLQ
jgi:5-methylcytosine-specific restriction endonuclease McrA